MNKLIRFCIIAGLIFLLSGLLLSACGAAMGGAAYPRFRPHRIHRIMEHLDDCLFPAVHLRRLKDGWELDAVGAALYDTPRGVEIQWDYSLHGHFVPRA